MSTSKWMSINKFMNSITEFTDGARFVVVFFDNFYKTKFNWTIKPIGYNLIKDKAELIPFSEIQKQVPDMEYIQFREDKNKRMSEIALTKKLYKLIIEVKEKEYKGFKYHQSFVKEANQDIYEKVVKSYEEEKSKALTEGIGGEDTDVLEMIANIEDMI